MVVSSMKVNASEPLRQWYPSRSTAGTWESLLNPSTFSAAPPWVSFASAVTELHHFTGRDRRAPDPQKIPGIFRYEIRMTRFVRRGDGCARVPKTLEVVVREADWTILHFMYY